MTAFTPLITIFLIILIGVFCQKKQIFNNSQREAFEVLLIKLIMPSYLFIAAYKNDLASLLDIDYICAFLITFLILSIVIALIFAKKIENTALCMRILGAGYINAGMYSLPVITLLLLNPTAAIIGNMLQVVLIQPLFIIYLNVVAHKDKSIASKIFNIITTPITIAPIIGILFNYLQIQIPIAMKEAFTQIGYGTSGLALFVFGMIIGATHITKNCIRFDLLGIVFAKNILHPIIAICVAHFMQLDTYWFNALIIASSSPTAFVIYMIAKQFGREEELIKKTITISSIISTISLLAISAAINLSA